MDTQEEKKDRGVSDTTVSTGETPASAPAAASSLTGVARQDAHPNGGEANETSRPTNNPKRSIDAVCPELKSTDSIPGSTLVAATRAKIVKAYEQLSVEDVTAKLLSLKDVILEVSPDASKESKMHLGYLVEECVWERIFGMPYGILPGVPRSHEEVLERDGQASWSLPPNLRDQYMTVWVHGDGNSFWRSLAISLWKSQYFHLHLKLFVLATSARRRSDLVADDRLLQKMITLGGSASGNPSTPASCSRAQGNNPAFENMLLEAIGYHCGDLRHTGRLMACLTCEAMAMTVKLLNPVDMVRYQRALLMEGGLSNRENCQGDNRHSATCTPLGCTSVRWRMLGENGGDDYCPEEIAVVMTKYNPLRKRNLQNLRNNDDPASEKDLQLNSLNHFSTLVDVGWKCLPFPLDVAAPPLDAALSSKVVEDTTRELLEWEHRKAAELKADLKEQLDALVGISGIGPWCNPLPIPEDIDRVKAYANIIARTAAAQRTEAAASNGNLPTEAQKDAEKLEQDLPGLRSFWTRRLTRISSVRNYPPTLARQNTCWGFMEGRNAEWLTKPNVSSECMSRTLPPCPKDAPMRKEADFVPGHLSSGYRFWADVVLRKHSQRDMLLRWLQGVSLSEFVDPTATGTFEGRTYSGAELTPAEFANHIALENEAWVDAQVSKLVTQGTLARWSDIADVQANPRPVMSLPLVVESGKRQLFWDGRWLNFMCRQVPFHLGGVADVAQLSWPGAHQVTLAHECSFNHVPLNPDSWKYFGVRWKGCYYVWTVLCSGWCSSIYVYHTLSDAVAQYLRSRDVPALGCLGEFWIATLTLARGQPPDKQAQAARVAGYIALSLLYHCGYFVSVAKCALEPTTRISFLGVTCDTARCRFEVPEDKLAEMESILNRATSEGVIASRPPTTCREDQR